MQCSFIFGGSGSYPAHGVSAIVLYPTTLGRFFFLCVPRSVALNHPERWCVIPTERGWLQRVRLVCVCFFNRANGYFWVIDFWADTEFYRARFGTMFVFKGVTKAYELGNNFRLFGCTAAAGFLNALSSKRAAMKSHWPAGFFLLKMQIHVCIFSDWHLRRWRMRVSKIISHKGIVKTEIHTDAGASNFHGLKHERFVNNNM